jgi:hypothetical protein
MYMIFVHTTYRRRVLVIFFRGKAVPVLPMLLVGCFMNTSLVAILHS